MKTQILFTVIISLIFYVVGSGINASFNLSNWAIDVRQITGGLLLVVIVFGWMAISAEQRMK